MCLHEAKQHLKSIVAIGEWINHESLVITECATYTDPRNRFTL